MLWKCKIQLSFLLKKLFKKLRDFADRQKGKTEGAVKLIFHFSSFFESMREANRKELS